jgi:hypothetical protein
MPVQRCHLKSFVIFALLLRYLGRPS